MESNLMHVLSTNFHLLHHSVQEDIFREFYKITFGPIQFIVNDHAATEDIIQEAFMQLLKKPPITGDEKQLRAWIRVVCKNLTLNYINKMKRNRNEIDLENDYLINEVAATQSYETVEKEVEVKFLEELINQYLLEMKPVYRFLLELKWKKQLTYKEIAEEMGTSEDIIRQKLHRAREALRKKLYKKWGVIDD